MEPKTPGLCHLGVSCVLWDQHPTMCRGDCREASVLGSPLPRSQQTAHWAARAAGQRQQLGQARSPDTTWLQKGARKVPIRPLHPKLGAEGAGSGFTVSCSLPRGQGEGMQGHLDERGHLACPSQATRRHTLKTAIQI